MAETKKRTASKLRAVEGEVHQFAVLGEMTGLLQRVGANKSKRAASDLVKTGPLHLQVIALDAGGEVKEQKMVGPYTIQCLLGRAVVSVQGRDHRVTTGDLVIVDAAIVHDIAAQEATVLLVTEAATGGTSG